MVCSNPKFGTDHNFLISGKTMLSKRGPKYTLDYLNSLSVSVHKINVIGPTELKFWLFKGFNTRQLNTYCTHSLIDKHSSSDGASKEDDTS